MQKPGLTATAIAAIVMAAVFASGGRAQPFTPKSLADKGNAAWANGRCLDAAMNYYALLQQPPGVLGNTAAVLQNRIRQCRQVLARIGTGGIDGKSDHVGRPPDGDRNPVALPPAPAPAAANAERPATAESGTIVLNEDPSTPPRVQACRTYAQTAVGQTRILAARNCGGLGQRVSSYEFHYRWCTERGTPERAQAFANQRAQQLNACLLRW